MIPVALPGASIGLGDGFTPARKLLDSGTSLAISTDWNPGSAPMGDLLVQAAIIGAYEKLSAAETLAGITFRAAAALNLGKSEYLLICLPSYSVSKKIYKLHLILLNSCFRVTIMKYNTKNLSTILSVHVLTILDNVR